MAGGPAHHKIVIIGGGTAGLPFLYWNLMLKGRA
jgi:hypothetical protein